MPLLVLMSIIQGSNAVAKPTNTKIHQRSRPFIGSLTGSSGAASISNATGGNSVCLSETAATASFGNNIIRSGAAYGIVFGAGGQTLATNCNAMAPVFVPASHQMSQHCN